MELGLYTFAELTPDPVTGRSISPSERLRNLIEEATLAVTGWGGEAIISCPQSLVVPERRSLAARRRMLRVDA